MKKFRLIDEFGHTNNNYLIKGNNINVMKELLSTFSQKIKLIYADPPYNNGDTYKHYSDNIDHFEWVGTCREQFILCHELLSQDGSLWVSIDDTGLPYIRMICDEIFGMNNYVATIVWERKNTRDSRKAFSVNHEYIVIYAKNAERWKTQRNTLPISDDILKRYKNPDNDPRGLWQSISLNVQDGHATANQFYTILSPSGKKFDPPKGRCWAYNKEKMDYEILQGNIWFGEKGNLTPRKKSFLYERKAGIVPRTIWTAEEVGTTAQAKKHLNKIFDKNVFDTPKPELLLERIIDIASNENEYVLDIFLGSGTTTVVAKRKNRKYIGIESGNHFYTHCVHRMKLSNNHSNGFGIYEYE